MFNSKTPNYSKANNVKYYLEGIPARRWRYLNKASYSVYIRLKKENNSDKDIIEYLTEKYINRICSNSINDIASDLRRLYITAVKKNESLKDLKDWFYKKNLSYDSKNEIWELVTTGKIEPSSTIEKWKKIDGTDNFYISNNGNFRKKVKDQVLDYIYPKPYPKKRYNKDKKCNRIIMHIKIEGQEYSAAKLVSTHFIPNPHKHKNTYLLMVILEI
ncbi:hypothetical protein CI105_04610 [Candidatus Izimaplasma bacterium ZiA1]|uniref:NUMOD4 domain-containing protein n=1 Tax=Candidatus Izimoplasma sp. ZiA1 TaxID=2024899 RepID=UPI000BAA48E6|nr:hypothetical protein CI105_04610 [Candidatus Izimaplasma bacterium ZiA1]